MDVRGRPEAGHFTKRTAEAWLSDVLDEARRGTGNRWTGLPAPPVQLLHKPCGERVTARVVCSNCGEDLDARDTEPVVGLGLIAYRGNRL